MADIEVITIGVPGPGNDRLRVNDITGEAYTLQLADKGAILRTMSDLPTSITIPAEADVAFPIGAIIALTKAAEGDITITAAPGVTAHSRWQSYLITTKYYTAILIKTNSDEWQFA